MSKRRPSVMKHKFSEVPKAQIQRSQFNRSHGHKTTFDAGKLVPIFWDEALPGDTFNLNLSAFARMATPIFPIMDNMYMDTHFFSVPFRLVWDNWQKMNGEQDNPGDSTDFILPTMTAPAGGFTAGSIHDYLGLPIGVEGIKVHSLYHRAIARIYNEWFRDQNLIDSLVYSTGDGPDDPVSPALNQVQRRAKRHDYFTSSLPFPQKGPDVLIPLGDTADIIGTGLINGIGNPLWDVGDQVDVALQPIGDGVQDTAKWSKAAGAVGAALWKDPQLQLDPAAGVPLQADLTTATAVDVNSMREAFQVQKLLERDARGGTRYPEVLKSHFGVTDPQHAVLQRSEYIGGGTSSVNISPIAQTSISGGETPLGTLAAMGTVGLTGHGFTKSFTEHCLIIGFVSVRADLTYQQGINRAFSRESRFDFFWPSLAHLGEQATLNKEIFAQGTAGGTADDEVFGYQERYAEYRYKPSQITGLFRSADPQSLDAWHLSQDFATLPVLDKTFIEENPPLDRCIAVPSEPHFIFDSYFDLKCARPMPVYAVPGYIDHF